MSTIFPHSRSHDHLEGRVRWYGRARTRHTKQATLYQRDSADGPRNSNTTVPYAGVVEQRLHVPRDGGALALLETDDVRHGNCFPP